MKKNPELCIPGEHSCKTNASEEVVVPVLDEQVVVVEEYTYACEEIVRSTCSLQVCSEIDIDRCVAQIMSMMLQSEESEDVCGGIEELAVSIYQLNMNQFHHVYACQGFDAGCWQ